MRRAFAVVTALLLLAGCASAPVDTLDLMPAPEAFGDGAINPLPVESPIADLPYGGILYATDRAPAAPGGKAAFYTSERGHGLRLGAAQVTIGDGAMTWAEARRVSMLKTRPGSYPIKVTGVKEFGILDTTLTPLVDAASGDPKAPGRVFAKAIDDKLAKSRSKDVFIYTHGYKVGFEHPILVGAELWHFLGYNGVFIAYAWPATPKTTAYVGDVELASGMARNLRELIRFIETETDAERIHIIGWSAGTRLVARTLEQMALINRAGAPGPGRLGGKLENVILLGSDMDRTVFGAYLADDILGVPRRLTVYASPTDESLGLSQFITGHARLGEMWKAGEMPARVKTYLKAADARLAFVNVGGAYNADVGKGHDYFRSSPWVSSDILMTLAYRLAPEDRGLVRDPETGVLSFPADYVARMNRTLTAHLPASGSR